MVSRLPTAAPFNRALIDFIEANAVDDFTQHFEYEAK
jgi:hypothetical protein